MTSKQKKILLIGLPLIVLIMFRKKIATSLNKTPFGGVSDSLFNLISSLEGFYSIPYWDRTGYSVGYGSQYNWDENRPVQKTDIIDKATAKRWLLNEAQQNYTLVQRLVNVPINDNQLTALSSFTYNVGETAFKESTLLSLLNSGASLQRVADEFNRWIYSGGIINKGLEARRAKERALFLS